RGTAFLFGSELKALLAHPSVAPEVDAEGLAEILAVGPARTPGHGVFRGVAELRPGHWLVHDRSGTSIRRYWTLERRPPPDDPETTAWRVRDTLQDPVERQLVSDVPVCTLLSGGLDSSAITAYASAALQRAALGAVVTYSVDYVDNERHFQPNRLQPNSDAPWVRRVSDFLGTSHHLVTIDTPELVDALTAAVRAHDRPCMADVDASLYLFCREIKKGATVGLSGECADEIFGGYPWFHNPEALAADTFPWARMTRQRSSLLSAEVAAWIRPEEYVAERYREALAEVPRLLGEGAGEARIREMSYLTITRFMPTLLDRKDRTSMAHGLEIRVPFCDHRLVGYVWKIPWAMKNWDQREKGLLRRALAGLLPEDVLWRRKRPYPKTHNPAYLAAVRDLVHQIVEDSGSPLLQLMDPSALRHLLRSEGSAFEPAWFGQLMGGAQLFAYLAQLDTWLREYRVVIH
ncbi:MAG: asparagine synthase (glutamine-hydrolyzing), partial [Firmicutes bacterium]|nr:asparagine synthase (glutamine-hydrolyzing) [Bacillota bacterium]